MEKSYKTFFYKGRLGADVTLDGTEHHHLANVRRCKVDEVVVLLCGDEFDYRYKITSIARDQTKLQFISKEKNKRNPKIELVVYMGLIRLENLSWVIEKLGEIGATELVPFTCARSNVLTSTVNLTRLQGIAEQSCKQSGRSIPLKVSPVLTFNEMLSQIPDFDAVFYADRGEKRAKITSLTSGKMQKVGLVLGPEGGLTLEENFEIASRATPITLGMRTLRSETAAIVGTTLILASLGEL